MLPLLLSLRKFPSVWGAVGHLWRKTKVCLDYKSQRHSPIAILKIEFVVTRLKKKSPAPDGVNGKFCKAFNEEVTPILLSLFPENRTGGEHVPTHYRHSITLIPTPKSTKKRKKTTDRYSSRTKCKNPQQNIIIKLCSIKKIMHHN